MKVHNLKSHKTAIQNKTRFFLSKTLNMDYGHDVKRNARLGAQLTTKLTETADCIF